MIAIFLVLLSVPQDKYSIPRSGKAAYARAVPRCTSTIAKIKSDPAAVVEVLDEILADRRVKRRECRIRWEVQPGTYSRYHDFFPYQYRARARFNLAKKAAPEEKMKFLEGAQKDLKESVQRGLPSSNDYLIDVELEIEKLNRSLGPDNPEPDFKREWNNLLSRNDFKNALEYVALQGSFLDDSQREKYLADTNQACRDYLASTLLEFLENMEKLTGVVSLEQMTRSGFIRLFLLPEKDWLTLTTPLFKWCLVVREVLDQLRKRKGSLDALLNLAVASASLSEKGNALAFTGVEKLAFDLVYQEIEGRVGQARSAPKGRLEQLRSEAQGFRGKWDGFQKRLREAAGGKEGFLKQIPDRNFSDLLDRFPIEAAELQQIPSRIQATIDADDPEQALLEVQRDVRKLRDRFPVLSVESRRGVIKLEIVIFSLGRFLAGESVSTVVREASTLGSELRALGGGFEVDSYGPRVRAVFDGLR